MVQNQSRSSILMFATTLRRCYNLLCNAESNRTSDILINASSLLNEGRRMDSAQTTINPL